MLTSTCSHAYSNHIHAHAHTSRCACAHYAAEIKDIYTVSCRHKDNLVRIKEASTHMLPHTWEYSLTHEVAASTHGSVVSDLPLLFNGNNTPVVKDRSTVPVVVHAFVRVCVLTLHLFLLKGTV